MKKMSCCRCLLFAVYRFGRCVGCGNQGAKDRSEDKNGDCRFHCPPADLCRGGLRRPGRGRNLLCLPENSPENYEPAPELMEKIQPGVLYFTFGVTTEKANILPNGGRCHGWFPCRTKPPRYNPERLLNPESGTRISALS